MLTKFLPWGIIPSCFILFKGTVSQDLHYWQWQGSRDLDLYENSFTVYLTNRIQSAMISLSCTLDPGFFLLRSLWPTRSLASEVSGLRGLWPPRSLASEVSRLWPLRSLASEVSGLWGLQPPRSLASEVSGLRGLLLRGLWPPRSLASEAPDASQPATAASHTADRRAITGD